MAIAANVHRRRTGVFLQEIQGQRCGPIGRPGSFVWRMLGRFRRRLRRVMTLDTGNGLGSVDTAVLCYVIDVTLLHAAQLGIMPEIVLVFWLSSFLRQCIGP